MALEVVDGLGGTKLVKNCFHESQDLMLLCDSNSYSALGPFFIGWESGLNPPRTRIYFDPQRATGIQPDSWIGLYNITWLSLNGIQFSPSIYAPELGYLGRFCAAAVEAANISRGWPHMIDRGSVIKCWLYENNYFVFPFFPFNLVAKHSGLSIDYFYRNMSLNVSGHITGNFLLPFSGLSLAASAFIPAGIDCDWPDEAQLSSMVDELLKNKYPPAFAYSRTTEELRQKGLPLLTMECLEVSKEIFEYVVVSGSYVLFKHINDEFRNEYLCAVSLPDSTDPANKVCIGIYLLNAALIDQIAEDRVINFFWQHFSYMRETGISTLRTPTLTSTGRGSKTVNPLRTYMEGMHGAELEMNCLTVAVASNRSDAAYSLHGGVRWGVKRVFDYFKMSFGRSTPLEAKFFDTLLLNDNEGNFYLPYYEEYCKYVNTSIQETVSGHSKWFYR